MTEHEIKASKNFLDQINTRTQGFALIVVDGNASCSILPSGDMFRLSYMTQSLQQFTTDMLAGRVKPPVQP
jgi:hypothetical protein